MEKLKSEYPAQVEFLAADLADFSVCFVFNLESWGFLGTTAPSQSSDLTDSSRPSGSQVSFNWSFERY